MKATSAKMPAKGMHMMPNGKMMPGMPPKGMMPKAVKKK